MAMLNVVLVQPEIPANTGNIGRTCVLTGTRLHLVGPLGFSLDDEAVRRAGLSYWQSLDLRIYDSWEAFLQANPAVAGRDTLDGEEACMPSSSNLAAPLAPTVHLLTKAGPRTYSDSTYHDGDWMVFGRESAGLDQALLAAQPERCERIPMLGDDALVGADGWHDRYDQLHPELPRDICGNFVDPRAGVISSLNLSNAVAIVLYEALRQLGFLGMS